MKFYQIGGNLNSFRHGGVQFRYGWHQTGVKSGHFESEICRIKHPKEVRRSGFSDNPSQYSFGRLNMVFFWRNGFGQTINITERPYKNALGLNFIYSVGANVAFLKPIFLDIYYPYSDGSLGGYLVSERYDPNKHTDIFRIYGNSNFFTGFNQMGLRAGAYGRAALAVEWGKYPDENYSLEAGMTLDAFPSGIPMMAKLPENKVFFGLYLAFNWGFKE